MSTKTIKVPVGKTVSWYVSEEGYVPQRGSYVMGDNAHSLNINLQTHQEAPLTMVFSGVAGTLSNIDTTKNVQYKRNDGSWTTAGSSIDVNPGDIIQFKGEYDSFGQNACWTLSSGVIIDKVCGNIGSVLDPVNYATMTTYSSSSALAYFFYGMRYGLIDAGDLVLPATTLTVRCYDSMFGGCGLLTKAPALPAMNLANYCYYNMFNNCDSLTVAPELPATTLANYCYRSMFAYCDGLTAAPDLLAETLASDCYEYMFRDCSHLNYIKCMSHSTMRTGWTYPYTNNWVNGVAAEGTFISYVHNSSWTTGVSAIPTGWVNQTIGDQHTITIVPTPADATVIMNGVEQSSIYDWYGNSYTWSVSKTGYVTQSGSGVIRGDETIAVNLVLEQHTFTINTDSANTVIINGEQRTSITADYGTAITWSVSREGYVSQSGSLTLTDDTTLPVNLILESHTFAITATPVGATVVINGQTRTSLTADWGTAITWSVSVAHYVSQNGSLTLTDDVTLPVDLVLAQHTFTINPTPADAVVTMNGVEGTSITADYGTTVAWSVSKDHYVTQNGSYIIGDNDYSLNVNLVLENHTFTITPTPVDAVVTINGIQRSSLTAPYGTAITWSVSKDHYVSQSGSLTLESNTTLPVSLVLENHTFTINTDSANTVVINGMERTSLTAPYGTAITWSVSRVGYTAQTGSYTLNQDHTESVSLVINQYTFTIDTDVENTVVINGQERSSITADYGTTITWSVSRENYVTQSGSFTLERNSTLYIALSLEQFTFSINPTPADAVVTINGQVRSSLTADYGTTISWSVSKTGYISQSGTHTLVDDYTENVTILIERHTFSISALPADAIVTINGEQRSSITADYGTAITWSVRKTGYVTQSGSFILQNDVALSITLVVEQFTFDIITTPADATVYINGVERSSLTAVYGTEISWRVEKEDYLAQSGTHTLTADYTLRVEIAGYLTFTVTRGGWLGWVFKGTYPYPSQLGAKTIEYSIDNGQTWQTWTAREILDGDQKAVCKHFNTGDVIMFRGNNDIYGYYTSSHGDEYCYFKNGYYMSSEDHHGIGIKIGGDIRSLLSLEYRDNLQPYAFYRLFGGLAHNQNTLEYYVDIDSDNPLILPSMGLAEGCYIGMFSWADDWGVPITIAPSLPATTLAEICYKDMFNGCHYLTSAPTLPATTLANSCYRHMFDYCNRLSQVTCLAENGIGENDSTLGWLYGTSEYGTFTKSPNSSWERNTSGIPEKWSVINAS